MTARLLLLSWGDGAVAGFLDRELAHDRAAGPVRIGFVGAAAVPYDEAPWSVQERRRLADAGHAVVEIDLDTTRGPALAAALDAVEVLYVGGGNTFYLLDRVRRSGLDDLLPAQFDRGLIYVGLSAGATLMGYDIEPIAVMDDPAAAPDLASTAGLGYLAEVPIPHVGGDLYPAETFDGAVRDYGSRFSLRLLRDDEALLVIDGSVEVIPSPVLDA